MVNVSKKLLQSAMLDKISSLLITHIIRMKTRKRAKTLLYELLTQAERAQLAKRFAIITMLYRGYATSDIEHTLNVSRTTIGKTEEALERGSYTATIAELKQASRGDLVIAFEALMRFSTQSGRGLSKFVNEQADQQYHHVKK